MKNKEGKSTNKDKGAEPKVMNSLLVCSFKPSCPNKPQKIVHYYQDVTPSGHIKWGPVKSNQLHLYYSSRCKTENRAEIVTNLPRSVKLASSTSPTKPLNIINSSWPIPLAPYFMKCKLIQKMPILIIRLPKDGKNLIGKRKFSGLTSYFNIKKRLICNPVFDASLFNRSFLSRTQVDESSRAI